MSSMIYSRLKSQAQLRPGFFIVNLEGLVHMRAGFGR